MKFIILSFFLLSSSYADDLKLKFAEELASQSDYFRAMTVLKEYEFLNRNKIEGFTAQKKIIQTHFKSNDFEMLDVNTEHLLKNYSQFLNVDMLELRAESLFLLQSYAPAYELLKTTNASIEKKYYFRAHINETPELPNCSSVLCKEIIDIESGSKGLPPKNTNLATALGIIPGLGQIYAGNTISGIGTFVLTGFFATVATVALNNNEKAFGIASITVGSVFYLSSIYAGHQTALKRNEGFLIIQKSKLKGLPISFKLMDLSFE